MVTQILELTVNVLIGAWLFSLATSVSLWSGRNFIKTALNKEGAFFILFLISLFLGYNVLLLVLLKNGGC